MSLYAQLIKGQLIIVAVNQYFFINVAIYHQHLNDMDFNAMLLWPEALLEDEQQIPRSCSTPGYCNMYIE